MIFDDDGDNTSDDSDNTLDDGDVDDGSNDDDYFEGNIDYVDDGDDPNLALQEVLVGRLKTGRDSQQLATSPFDCR